MYKYGHIEKLAYYEKQLFPRIQEKNHFIKVLIELTSMILNNVLLNL